MHRQHATPRVPVHVYGPLRELEVGKQVVELGLEEADGPEGLVAGF